MGAGEAGNYTDQAYHLVLPAIALGLGWVGYIARLVRASMLEVMEENHIRTARAFGLPERTVIVHYALRIALLPTVTILGLGIGTMLSGALFAEIVFSRPGIGKLLYEAVLNQELPHRDGLGAGHHRLFRAQHAGLGHHQCHARSASARAGRGDEHDETPRHYFRTFSALKKDPLGMAGFVLVSIILCSPFSPPGWRLMTHSK